MKHIVNKKGLLFAAGCFFALATTTSCINESLDACASHKLTVKVVNEKGDDITGLGDRINEASVYIFDESLALLETVKMTKADVMGRRLIELSKYPANKKLHVVAWGNAFGGAQNVTEGQIIEQLKVMLKSENELANFPNQLHYGNEQLITKATEVEVVDTVTIALKIGQIMLETLNMPAKYLDGLRAGKPIELAIEKTLDTYNYEGKLQGDSVYYAPPALPDTEIGREGEMSTGWQNLVEKEQLRVSFAVEGDPTKVEVLDINNNPITVRPGDEVIARFVWGEDGQYIGLEVTVRPWGYSKEHHEELK